VTAKDANQAMVLCAEEDTGTPYSRRSGTSTDPGDVELIERGLGAGEFNSYGVAGERCRGCKG
jgi:hypothetical protein